MKIQNPKNFLFLTVLLFAVFFVVLPYRTNATVNLEVGIGTSFEAANLSDYLSQAYTFITGSIGIISAVMIMFNGFNWAIAMGNAEEVSKAKSGITSAIMGLVLALISYTLLNILNPALVENQEPSVPGVVISSQALSACQEDTNSTNTVDSACTGLASVNTTFTTATGPAILQLASGSIVTAWDQLAEAYFNEFGEPIPVVDMFRAAEYQGCIADTSTGDTNFVRRVTGYGAVPDACGSAHTAGSAISLDVQTMGQEKYDWVRAYTQRPGTNFFRFVRYNSDIAAQTLQRQEELQSGTSFVGPCNVCPGTDACNQCS